MATKIVHADSCPTCTRSAHSPFRTFDVHGKVVAGCVDHFHTGHLAPISESNRWHGRPAAAAIRRAAKAMRDGFVTELGA